MNQIAGINPLDILIGVLLGVGILIGILRGVLPQLISIISMWLALVATLWLYKPFSVRILQGVGLPALGSDTLAFLILIIVFSVGIGLIIKALSTPPEERKQKKKSKEDPLAEAAKSATQRFVVGPLNMIGGAIMGFILTGLWIALILGLLQFIFQPAEVPLEQAGSFTRGITTNMHNSILVPYFNQVLILLFTSVSRFAPRNADILNQLLQLLQ
ncbi:MAG: CvpA family protein [Anaerolineae bacterium]|nr:CvpA family protein [Anaerolineae bacterium]